MPLPSGSEGSDWPGRGSSGSALPSTQVFFNAVWACDWASWAK